MTPSDRVMLGEICGRIDRFASAVDTLLERGDVAEARTLIGQLRTYAHAEMEIATAMAAARAGAIAAVDGDPARTH